MTTSPENLEQFSEGNKARGKYLTTLFDMLMQLSTKTVDEEIIVTAAQAAADIALWDSETEQREIANLLAVVNSPEFEKITRIKARDRIITMLELG